MKTVVTNCGVKRRSVKHVVEKMLAKLNKNSIGLKKKVLKFCNITYTLYLYSLIHG